MSKLGKRLINTAKSAQAIAKGEPIRKPKDAYSGPPRRAGHSEQTENESERIRRTLRYLAIHVARLGTESAPSRRSSARPMMVIDKEPDAVARARRLIYSSRLRRSRRPGVPRSERRLEPDRWRVPGWNWSSITRCLAAASLSLDLDEDRDAVPSDKGPSGRVSIGQKTM
jgi:hypothetical protein